MVDSFRLLKIVVADVQELTEHTSSKSRYSEMSLITDALKVI